MLDSRGQPHESSVGVVFSEKYVLLGLGYNRIKTR